MRQLLIAVLSTATLAAGEAPPLISVAVPDAARTAKRLEAGPYGRIWQQPAVQQLRDALGKLPDADPAWLSLVDRVQELRFELVMAKRLPDGKAPADLVVARLALRLPPGQDPKAPEGSFATRSGEWWLLGSEKPAAPPGLPSGSPDADLRMVVDLGGAAAMAEAAEAARTTAVVAAVGISRIEVEGTAFPGGVRENALVRGWKPPLKPVDTAVLAGMPERPLGIAAVGIDGKALVAYVHAIAAAGDGGVGLKQADAALQAQVGVGLDELLASLDGTITMSATQGMPAPGILLSLPANPLLDRVATRLLDLVQPGSGAELVAQAATQPVILPLPPTVPVVAFVRRTPTRWLIGTDQAAADAVSAANPAPYPVAAKWPAAAGALVLGWADTKAQAQAVAGLLPMAQTTIRDPQQRKLLMQVQGAIVAMIPHLPPGMFIGRQSPDGLRFEGENGILTEAMPTAVAAGMLLPAINLVRQQAQRSQAGNNMRQLCIGMIAYGNDFDQAWPKDFDELITWSNGDLTPKLLQAPGHPEIAKPFLYVRPCKAAKAIQPVLVQDPACNRGKGSMVCYADGHIAYVKGVELWTQAQKLAVQPKAAGDGIEVTDWTGLEGQAPAQPGKPSDAGF